MKKIMTPGPTQVRENVRMARSLVTTNPDLDLEFYEYYKDTCDLLSRLLHTKNVCYILGLEAACASLTEPGDRVLVLDNGIFGKGFADFVKIYGGKPVLYTADYHRDFDVTALANWLESNHDFKYAAIVHCDTPTGVQNNIEAICPLLKRYGILSVVDAVSSMFGVDIDDIEVVVHRESIIHSMVEFCDNSIIGQMSLPSMKHPIQYAFTYPERLPSADMQVNFKELGKMTFYEPDRKTFRCLDLAEKAGKIGGTMPTIINAANEAAVNGFLNGKVKFLEIAEIAESAMSEFSSIQNPSLNDIIETDREVRETICQRF